MSRPPVRVGVNLLWLVPGVVGGSEEYTVRLLRGIARSAPADLHLTLFVLDGFAAAHPDLVAALASAEVHLLLRGRDREDRSADRHAGLARVTGELEEAKPQDWHFEVLAEREQQILSGEMKLIPLEQFARELEAEFP